MTRRRQCFVPITKVICEAKHQINIGRRYAYRCLLGAAKHATHTAVIGDIGPTTA